MVQLLIVGTLGHVQGFQLLSEYIGAKSTVSTQGQGVQLLTVGTWGQGGMGTWGRGSSCLQLVHECRRMWGQGSTCLQWVHGSKGASCLVGTWGQGSSCLLWDQVPQ